MPVRTLVSITIISVVFAINIICKKCHAETPPTTINCIYLGESIYRCENSDSICHKLSNSTSLSCFKK